MKWWITLCLLGASIVAARGEETGKVSNVKEPELRAELLQRFATDQEIRKAIADWSKKRGSMDATKFNDQEKSEFEKLGAAIHETDKENTAWLKEVVTKYGWPTNSMVGPDGANAAWLLVQHADADAVFQRKCLDLMTQLPKNEVSQSEVAYLTDRVLLAEGKKQIYGTQFEEVDGEFRPRPLEDEANVDKRRAEVGLPPLAEYLKQAAEAYGIAGKK